jgi:hypothetical protein
MIVARSACSGVRYQRSVEIPDTGTFPYSVVYCSVTTDLCCLHNVLFIRQTAKMVSESAVCLAQDFEQLNDAVGVLTPSTAMGHVLRQRLTRAGVVFDLTV